MKDNWITIEDTKIWHTSKIEDTPEIFLLLLPFQENKEVLEEKFKKLLDKYEKP